MKSPGKVRARIGRALLAFLTTLAISPALPSRAVAQAQTFSISGRVDSNGAGTGTPVPGVTMTLTNTTTGATVATQLTDADGRYSFTGVAAGGNYTFTPSKTGYNFQPVSRGFGNFAQSWPNQFFQAAPGPTVQFSSDSYSASEAEHAAQITVTRTNASGTASVSYSTSDGTANSRSDYGSAAGTLVFADGESSKSFTVLLTDDSYVEGDETVLLRLSPVDVYLGTPAAATLTIRSDDVAGQPNPIDESANFVRQHYHDFLNREPDTSGLNFWVGQTTGCGASDPQVCRVNVSAAFFLSIEFQNTGYFVYKTYKAAFGNVQGAPVPVRLRPFLADTQAIGQGVVVGQGNWQQQLDANKTSYALSFVQRPDFQAKYPAGMSAAQFVDALFANAGVTPTTAERQAAVDAFGAGDTPAGRAAALRSVADSQSLQQGEFNRAFVLMQYFGYLRRDPDSAPDSDFSGYNFWLSKLNQFGGNYVNAEMVKAFISSTEYRQRFGGQSGGQ